MNYLSYKQIQNIQDRTTKKLIDYINEFLKDDNSLDSIEFYYPNFDEQKTKVAFNVWVSTDYKTSYNKTFIEHMLEEKSNQLSRLEKDVLIERNKSYVSLFEVFNTDGEYIELVDLLTRRYHTIWEPSMANILKSSDLIFGRIGKVISHENFIGNISFLPPSIKDIFIEEVFLDYNYIRLKESELTINKYLKEYSINLYKIYTECVYNALDLDEDTTSIFYDEVEEFESYLRIQTSRPLIKKHITNLINLYEFYFLEQDITLYDLDQIDLDELFKDAIKEGFISSQWTLSSYISTLKEYLKFLKARDLKYKQLYDDIIKISKNRFLYSNDFREISSPFSVNINLSTRIANVLNERALRFVMDYERFILYVMNDPLQSTVARKHIKRKDLLKINEIMENQESPDHRAPNQTDFKMIDLFYNFSVDNELIEAVNNMLIVSKKGPQFLRLSDEEKYSILIEYIWSYKFLYRICKSASVDDVEKVKRKILQVLSRLKANTPYKINTLFPVCIDFPKFLSMHSRHLELMGLIKQNQKPHLTINITPLGKSLFSLLIQADKPEKSFSKIIDLNDYIK